MAEKTVKSRERKERLAAALRDNLKKRKIQARAAAGEEASSTSQPTIESEKNAPQPPK